MEPTSELSQHPHSALLEQVRALDPAVQQQILEQVTLSGKTDPGDVAAGRRPVRGHNG